jgi:hypothetical protein
MKDDKKDIISKISMEIINSNNQSPIQDENMQIKNISEFKNFLEELTKKIKANKNSILLTLVGLGISYYLYRKIISPNINKIIEKIVFKICNNNQEEQLNLKNPLQKFENYYAKTLKKILNFHKENLNKFTSVNELYNNLTNGKKEQITPMWIIFKFKVFLYFFSCIYSTRFCIIINQIQVLLLERIRINENGNYFKVTFTIQEEILKENEMILNDFSQILFKKIENLIKPICDEILINSTFSLEKFDKLIKKFRLKIEEIMINKFTKEYYYKLFCDYKFKLLEKIEFYENQDFYKSYSTIMNSSNKFDCENALKEHRNNTEAYLKFYSLLFDILNSNIFNILLINSFEYDFSIIDKTIKLNFDAVINSNIRNSQEIPIAKILSFMMKIYENILDEKKSIYFIKEFNGKKFNEELNYIYRYITE